MAAFAWRRRTIAQAIAGAAARVAMGAGTERRELRGLRAVALGPRSVLPLPRVHRGDHRHEREEHDDPPHRPRRGQSRSAGGHDQFRTGSTSAVSWSRLGTGPARRGRSDPRRAGSRPRRPRDGPWRDPSRGIGYEHNDVSVVTNVSADHLRLHGIDTSTAGRGEGAVVRITRREGWAVLNAEDPRVWKCGSTVGPDRTRSAYRPGHQPCQSWPRVGGHRSSSAADSCSSGRGAAASASSRWTTCQSRSPACPATTWQTPWQRPRPAMPSG